MDKTPQKFRKDPKRVEEARKGKENYMNKLKKSILNDAKKGSGDTSNVINETTRATSTATTPTTSTTSTATTRPSDTYIYGVGILAVLVITICVYFTYNSSQVTNKKNINGKQDQPPKRLHMFYI